ncbi:MAG: hypothetical protein II557_04990 [Clostridia bacterium]|nr:hypothetical protein [Clostridia bacterium]
MKKLLPMLLAALLLAGLCIPGAAAGEKVVRSPQALNVDGRDVPCDVYNIDGYNYFKLRDIAALLNGTGSQFDVQYNEDMRAIILSPGSAYEQQPDDLRIGDDLSASAAESAQAVRMGGGLIGRELLARFNIGGFNYFRLRELGDLLGFGVAYSAAANAMYIVSRSTPLDEVETDENGVLGWYRSEPDQDGEYDAVLIRRCFNGFVIDGYDMVTYDGEPDVMCYWAQEIVYDEASGIASLQTFSGFSQAGTYWDDPVPCRFLVTDGEVSVTEGGVTSRFTRDDSQRDLIDTTVPAAAETMGEGDPFPMTGRWTGSAAEDAAAELILGADQSFVLSLKKNGEPVEVYRGVYVYDAGERTVSAAATRIGYAQMPHMLSFAVSDDSEAGVSLSLEGIDLPGSPLKLAPAPLYA